MESTAFSNLKGELSSSVDANNALTQRIREMTARSSERDKDDAQLQETVRALRADADRKDKAIADLQRSQESLEGRLRAERESADVARLRAETSARAREALEKQLDDIRQSHKLILQLNSELEAQVATQRSTISKLESEVHLSRATGYPSTANTHSAPSVTSTAAATSAPAPSAGLGRRGLHLGARGLGGRAAPKAVTSHVDDEVHTHTAQQLHEPHPTSSSELETLRDQVSSLRRELLRREMTDDNSGGTTASADASAAAWRSGGGSGTGSGSGLYEEIIQDLRKETSRLALAVQEAHSARDDALRRCQRLTEVEEELQLQKEVSELVSAESKNASRAISASSERVAKFQHQQHILQADVSRLEGEVTKITAELSRTLDDLSAEKSTVRTAHAEKLAAERKAAEAVAVQTSLEATLDEWRASHTSSSLEISRANRSIADLQTANVAAAAKLAQMEREVAARDAQIDELSSAVVQLTAKEEDSLSALSLSRHQHETMALELDAAKNSLATQRQVFDTALSEAQELRAQLEEARWEKDFHRRDAAMLESSRVEAQLGGLRRDLEATIADWRAAEKDKEKKRHLLEGLQAELVREREKNHILQSEVSFLSERLQQTRVAALAAEPTAGTLHALGHGTSGIGAVAKGQCSPLRSGSAGTPFSRGVGALPVSFSSSAFRPSHSQTQSQSRARSAANLDTSRLSLDDLGHHTHGHNTGGAGAARAGGDEAREALRRRREERARKREHEAALSQSKRQGQEQEQQQGLFGGFSSMPSTPASVARGGTPGFSKSDFERARVLLLSAAR